MHHMVLSKQLSIATRRTIAAALGLLATSGSIVLALSSLADNPIAVAALGAWGAMATSIGFGDTRDDDLWRGGAWDVAEAIAYTSALALTVACYLLWDESALALLAGLVTVGMSTGALLAAPTRLAKERKRAFAKDELRSATERSVGRRGKQPRASLRAGKLIASVRERALTRP
jgi:hypothetical protein